MIILLIAVVRAKNSSISRRPNAHLKGPGAYEFDIVGESNYQSELEAICGGRKEESAEEYRDAVLVLEDDNPFDNKAVRVDIDGVTVGYLSRKDARSYRKQLSEKGAANYICSCNALIVGGGFARNKIKVGSE